MRHNPGGPLDRARPTLLLTRPDAQSRVFAKAFRARFGADWPVIISPLTAIRFLDAGPVPAKADGIIFTSQNAVSAFARRTADRGLMAWCVGARTADIARDAGFDVIAGPGDAGGLVQMIIETGAARRMIYPRGVSVSVDMAGLLAKAGIETLPMVIYDQAECPPTAEAVSAVRARHPLLLPLFSPKSAQRAAAAFPDPTAPLLIAAISSAVADAAAAFNANRVEIAAQPDADAMLDTLAGLIDVSDIP